MGWRAQLDANLYRAEVAVQLEPTRSQSQGPSVPSVARGLMVRLAAVLRLSLCVERRGLEGSTGRYAVKCDRSLHRSFGGNKFLRGECVFCPVSRARANGAL